MSLLYTFSKFPSYMAEVQGPEQAPPLYHPDAVRHIELPHDSTLVLETYRNEEVGIAGVVGHWGEVWDRSRMDPVIAERYHTDEIDGTKFVATATGFDKVYRPPEGQSYDISAEQEKAAMVIMGQSALEENGWEPDEVDVLLIGGDAPPIISTTAGETWGAEIARSMGLDHLDSENDIFEAYMACDSGGELLREALSDASYEGKKVLMITGSGMLGIVPTIDTADSDAFSMQVFTLGGTAIGFIPGETLSMMRGPNGEYAELYYEIEDEERVLGAKPPYDHLLDPEGPLLQKFGNIKYGRLPVPFKEGRMLDMQPKGTGIFFANGVVEVAKAFKEKHPWLDLETIAEWIFHHASFPVVKGGIKRILRKLGIDIKDKVHWSLDDGNPPPAATTIAFVRRLKDLTNKNFMVFSFGAGSFWSLSAARLGSWAEYKQQQEESQLPVAAAA